MNIFVPEQIQANIADCLPIQQNGNAFLVAFHGNDVLLDEASKGLPRIMQARELLTETPSPVCIGTLDDIPCLGVELTSSPSDTLPTGLAWFPARSLLCNASAPEWNAAARAREIIYWRNRHRFCGQCGVRLMPSRNDLALACENCNARYYPQIAPAVIVAIWRWNGGQKELLLAHNRKFSANIYGLIAGFVEAGETVEQAIHREIREETQLEVKNCRYLKSQTWPFPNSLMLGFEAEYAGGTATPDGEEITSLGWFGRDKLPLLPNNGSIARNIIMDFFQRDN